MISIDQLLERSIHSNCFLISSMKLIPEDQFFHLESLPLACNWLKDQYYLLVQEYFNTLFLFLSI